MIISPVNKENNLLYATAEIPAILSGKIGTDIFVIAQPVTIPTCIIAQPATIPSVSVITRIYWISLFISLITLFLAFINKFKLKQKMKKGYSNIEEIELKYKKCRNIYLNIATIVMLVFNACVVIDYWEYLHFYEFLEWLYMIVLSYYIITLVKNKIKYKKCKETEKEKYSKLIETSSIMLLVITFTTLLLTLLLMLPFWSFVL